MAFDLSAYAGRTVEGSTASVELYLIGGDGTSSPVPIISVFEASVGWDESSATWNSLGGATYVASYSGTPLDSAGVAWNVGAGQGSRWITWDLPTSLIQDWIDSASSNRGLVFMVTGPSVAGNDPLDAAGFDRRFASSEHVYASIYAPRLNFDLAVPEPASCVLVGLGLGAFAARRRRRT